MCVSILAVNLMGPWRWPSYCFWRCLKACCPGSSGSSHLYEATLKIYQLKRKYLHRRYFTRREKVASFFIISTTCPKEFWKSEMCSPNNPTPCLFLSERDSQGFIFQQKHQLNNKVWGFNFSSTLWDFYNVLFLFWVTAAILCYLFYFLSTWVKSFGLSALVMCKMQINWEENCLFRRLNTTEAINNNSGDTSTSHCPSSPPLCLCSHVMFVQCF